MAFVKGADFAPHNMTAATTPAPYAVSDNGHFATLPGYMAFDGILTNTGYFAGSTVGNVTLLLDLGAGNSKKCFSFAIHVNTTPEPARAPKDYKVQGSNNGTSFTDLGSTTGQVSWGSGETRETNCTVVGTAWRYFQVVMTANNGDPSFTQISELYLYEAIDATLSRKAPLVIQHGQVTADQTAMPVLITAACLPAEMVTLGGANAAQANGGDIQFTTDVAGTSRIACEIVTWTQNAVPASALVQIWVPVDVKTAVDVTIWVWYKSGGGLTQPATGAAFGSQAVWDANFKAVYHPVVSANNTANADSTGAHNITSVGVGGIAPVLTSNQMGKAWNWTGTNANGDVLPAAGNAMFNNSSTGIPTGSAASTLECWFNLNGQLTPADNTGQGMFGWGGGGSSDFWCLAFHNDNKLYLSLQWASFPGANIALTPDTSWHHAVVTNPSGNTAYSGVQFYLDGVLKTLAGSSGTIVNTFSSIAAGTISGPHNWHYKGMLGEMRISNVARSTSWIATQYNSQNSPSTFIIVGTPSGVGDATLIPAVATLTFSPQTPTLSTASIVSLTCSILISGGGSGTSTSTLTCSIGIGYGGLATNCGAPPAATVGIGGFVYRPPVTMGSVTLSPIYDLNHTLTWEVSALPPGLSWDGNPASSTYGHIVGTPTLAGTFFYSYTVSSPDGQRISNSCMLIVNPGAPGTGPSDIVACSIVIAPADSGEAPCPPDAVGGAG